MTTRKVAPGHPDVAVAYLRASTDEQHLSVPAQRACIRAWAAGGHVAVVGWYVDRGVCSVAPIEERPALGGPRRARYTGGGCAGRCPARSHRPRRRPGGRDRAGGRPRRRAPRERDGRRQRRLARGRLPANGHRRGGPGRAGLNPRRPARAAGRGRGEGNGDSPADAFLRTVIDGAAQDERALIRARTRASLAAKRARRELVGAIPYGFALRGDGMPLVAARQEQATIARARGLRARGLSLRAVAAKLGFRGTRQPSRTPVSASADRAHVGRSERARIAERPIRGFLTIPRRTLQIQVVRDLERSFPERHQCVIHRVAPAPLSLAPKNMIPIHHLSPSWHHAFILPSVFDSGSLVSRCSRRRPRGSNRGRRGDAGERGRYTREDGPEAIPKAIPKAAGKHVVIGSGSGR